VAARDRPEHFSEWLGMRSGYQVDLVLDDLPGRAQYAPVN